MNGNLHSSNDMRLRKHLLLYYIVPYRIQYKTRLLSIIHKQQVCDAYTINWLLFFV